MRKLFMTAVVLFGMVADLAIAQSLQAITQCAAQNHRGQSIKEERRLAQFPLTLD
jgi:hypothetical protein